MRYKIHVHIRFKFFNETGRVKAGGRGVAPGWGWPGLGRDSGTDQRQTAPSATPAPPVIKNQRTRYHQALATATATGVFAKKRLYSA